MQIDHGFSGSKAVTSGASRFWPIGATCCSVPRP
jgi:hypothetical protein